MDFILNIGNFTQSTVGMCSGHRFLKVRLVCCLNEVTEVIILVSLVSEATANSLVQGSKGVVFGQIGVLIRLMV